MKAKDYKSYKAVKSGSVENCVKRQIRFSFENNTCYDVNEADHANSC